MTDLGDIACSLYGGASRQAIALVTTLALLGAACAPVKPRVQQPSKAASAPAEPRQEEPYVVLLPVSDTTRDKLPDYRYRFSVPSATGPVIGKLDVLSNQPALINSPYQLLARSPEIDGSTLYILRSDKGDVYSFTTDQDGNPTTPLHRHTAGSDGYHVIGAYRVDSQASPDAAISLASAAPPPSRPASRPSHAVSPSSPPETAAKTAYRLPRTVFRAPRRISQEEPTELGSASSDQYPAVPAAATAVLAAVQGRRHAQATGNEFWRSPWVWGPIGVLAGGAAAYFLFRGDDDQSASPALQPYDPSGNNRGPGDR